MFFDLLFRKSTPQGSAGAEKTIQKAAEKIEGEGTYTATVCGHGSTFSREVSKFGTQRDICVPENHRGSADYCIDCMVGNAIQCGLCEDLILMNESVGTLAGMQRSKVPPHAAILSDNEESVKLVICGKCIPTGMWYAGNWLPGPDGKCHVKPFSSDID